MKKEVDLFEQFDSLNAIEPSAEWNEHLMMRLNGPGTKKNDYSGSKWVLYAIFLLLAINMVSITTSWLNERSQQNALNMRSIATEYLISSNSSKF
jgi:hypothetical protein